VERRLRRSYPLTESSFGAGNDPLKGVEKKYVTDKQDVWIERKE